MKLVKTEESRAGQRVVRDVTDLKGNLLFPAGTELSAERIASCRQHNISHLFVEDEQPGEGAPADPAARLEALMADIDRQFAGHEASPLMMELREAVKRHHAARRPPA
jgi:hypothetical protein